MVDWHDAQENPFKVTPGHGSDVTTTSAASSSRRPDPAMHPISVVSLLPRVTIAATDEAGILKYDVEHRDHEGKDVSKDTNSVVHRGEIHCFPPLSSIQYLWNT